MFDLFGIKKRKLAKLKKLESHRNRMVQVKQSFVEPYLEEKRKDYEEECKRLQQEDRERVRIYNHSCPRCGSSDIIDRYIRGKGDISGRIRSTSAFSVGGSVQGSYDTLPVNECRNCGNQFEKREPVFRFAHDYKIYPFEPSWYATAGYVIRRMLDVVENKKPLQIPYYMVESFQDIPREVLELIIYQTLKKEPSCSRQNNLKALGKCYTTDIYSPCYNDREYLWEIKDTLWLQFQKVLK